MTAIVCLEREGGDTPTLQPIAARRGDHERKQAAQRGRAAFLIKPEYCNRRGTGFAALAIGHLLRHVKNQLTISFFHFAQQAAKLVEKACFLADRSPGDVIR
jgi:hypothetical protein